MTGFLVRNNVSVWLVVVSLMVTATMMHPTFASLLTLTLNTGVLFALRMVARAEGRHQLEEQRR